jgi:hypothetical protein
VTEKKDETLTAQQTAVLQLVTITPAPRTEDELAKSYDGLRRANLWPKQSQGSVKERIGELVKLGKLKRGKKTPSDEPTIELAKS